MSKDKKSQIQEKNDKLLLIIAIIIVVVSFVVFFINPLDVQSLYKVLMLLGGFLVASVVFFKSSTGVIFWDFLRETRIELRKVVWPSREDTLKVTGMILIAVTIIAIFLQIIDGLFAWIVQLLIR